jgi:hypothetical protein
MPPTTIRDHLKDSLAGVDFPASRNDLIDAATGQGDPTAVQALRALPDQDYADLDSVFEAVGASGDGFLREE